MTTPSLPWYKHKLVWMLIAPPAAAIVAGMFTIWLAVTTSDGLVVDDYYKKGKAINRSLKRDKLASELGLSAQLNIEETDDILRVYLDKGSLPRYPEKLTLHLQHATQSNLDQLMQLAPAPDGLYIGYLSAPIQEGIWHISLATNEWRLVSRVRWQDGMNINLTTL